MTRAPCPCGVGFETEWAVGDLAECINRIGWLTRDGAAAGPQYGEIRRVANVRVFPFSCGCRVQALDFVRYPDGHYAASEFRKVTPRADEASRADAAFIAGLKPARQPVPEHA